MKNINVRDTMIKLGNMPEEERLRFIEDLCTANGIFAYRQGNEFFNNNDFFTITNLIIPAKVQKDKIILTAHYDVIPGSFGYNDNLSGVITLILLAGEVADNVEIVFCDKEESGYKGASYYIFKNNYNIKMNINVDIVGIPGMIYFTSYPTYKKSTKPIAYKQNNNKNFYSQGTRQYSCLVDNDAGFTYYDYSKGVIDKEVIMPITEETVEIVHLPFNDSKAFDKHNIPSVIIMSGPDVTKAKNIDGAFLSAVMQYQHNGPKDNNIELISEDNIKKIASFVQDIIKENN